MIRIRAILYALWHGLLPWQWYEREKHYKGSYLGHLLLNARYAFRWLTWQEYESDQEFEKETNNNY